MNLRIELFFCIDLMTKSLNNDFKVYPCEGSRSGVWGRSPGWWKILLMFISKIVLYALLSTRSMSDLDTSRWRWMHPPSMHTMHPPSRWWKIGSLSTRSRIFNNRLLKTHTARNRTYDIYLAMARQTNFQKSGFLLKTNNSKTSSKILLKTNNSKPIQKNQAKFKNIKQKLFEFCLIFFELFLNKHQGKQTFKTAVFC